MTAEIRTIDAAALTNLQSAIGEVYQHAFATTDDQVERFITEQLTRHARYAGFRFRVALDGEHVVGFVYGYHSASGHWWHDKVSPALEQAGHGWWLTDAFEFVELAVAPTAQGQGIGGRLHDAVLRDIPYQKALLSTAPPPTNAMHLYRSRGWIPLIEDFRYVEGGDPVVLMGLRLPLAAKIEP